MIAHHVFAVLAVCCAVVIAPANTGPMNFLKGMVGDKNGTTRTKSVRAGMMFTAATTVVLPSDDVNARFDRNDIVNRDDDSRKNNKNNRENNVVLQRLVSAVLYAATMSQQRKEVADTTAGSVGTSSLSPLSAVAIEDTSTSALQVDRRHQYSRKSYRKRFPPAGYGSGLHEWFGVTVRPSDSYRDPILAQETSRGVDYLTSYPLAKGGGTEYEEKYYEEVEPSVKVWKTKVVGEPMAKSSRNNEFNADDDDDDDDDEIIAVAHESQ